MKICKCNICKICNYDFYDRFIINLATNQLIPNKFE